MPAGRRPTLSVVGIHWRVNQINAAAQPMQDAPLERMGLADILGGLSHG